jgi:excisionase family DNA binding protein
VTVPPDPLVQVLSDLAAVGRKLVETSESALALLAEREAECPVSMPTPPDTAILTAKEVADLLRVTERTFRRLRSSGQGPQPIKVRGALRWRREAVDRWIARKQE